MIKSSPISSEFSMSQMYEKFKFDFTKMSDSAF
jgi:hypothetical protein